MALEGRFLSKITLVPLEEFNCTHEISPVHAHEWTKMIAVTTAPVRRRETALSQLVGIAPRKLLDDVQCACSRDEDSQPFKSSLFSLH